VVFCTGFCNMIYYTHFLMLRRLTVSNLAVVEKASVEFAAGLNVITGETGAGKSVLMGALDLVLGGRADPGEVRDGATEAEVSAEFDDLAVRRTITAQGRSRAWINDESVAISELKALGARLVDIHGPRANQRLLEEDFQRDALDAYAGDEKERSAYAARWATYSAARAALEALDAAASEDELDMLRYQVNELEAADLTEDDETVAERHAAAAHAEEIVADANAVTEGLGGERSAAEILIALQPRFRDMARHFPAAADWAAQAEDLTLRLQELSRTVADAASRLDLGEEDMATLDARLTVLNNLKRKFRADSVAALLETLAHKKARLDDLEHRDERIAELKAALEVEEVELRKAGAALTKSRTAAGAKFAKAVTKELKDLGFLQAKFFVALEPADPAPHGLDRVVYMFEPNPGETARPLATIASSGEIARVMLALKTVTTRAADTSDATLVFDEIDANIGGEVGRVVGEKMRAVAKGRQVVAITHLPQSAVFGARHLVVSKAVSGGRTRTHIAAVDGEERVSEIARMLGGEKLTTVVRKHAQELLGISR